MGTDATKWELGSVGVREFGQYHCGYRELRIALIILNLRT